MMLGPTTDEIFCSISAESFRALLMKRRDKLAKEVELLKEKSLALKDVETMLRCTEDVEEEP